MVSERGLWVGHLKRIIYFLVLVALFSPRVLPSNLSSPAQTGTVTVTGRWLYYFNATHTLPVILASVQIYNLEQDGLHPVGNTVLTDGNGYFNSGQISNNDGHGNRLDIVVGVYAVSSAAAVKNPSTNSYYCNYTSTVWINCPDGTLNVGDLNTSYVQRGAWWIYSVQYGLVKGWLYLYNTVGYNTPQVTAFWPYGDWPKYWTNATIHLPDWACWWSDIMLHEYGHHVMNSLYGYIPPCMQQHSINLQSDNTTAWAEGWADFYPLAVYNKPIFTWSNGTHYANINLETPTWYSTGWDDGDKVEGRVAGALWDIFDSQNDNTPWYYNHLSDGFQRIWSIMHTTSCDTFREFWQARNITGYLRNDTLMAIFQNTIDCRGPGDVDASCHVDMADISLVIDAFMTTKGDPGFDKRCDLNNDDSVDMADINIVIDNFGNDY